MKKFLSLISALFICTIAFADTINLRWLNEDGSVYSGGSQTCTIGGNFELPPAPIKPGYEFTGWEIVSYQELSYLESSGTQYIDTGIIPNQNTITILDAQLLSGYGVLFGVRTSAEVDAYTIQKVLAGDWAMGYGSHFGQLPISADNDRHVFTKNKTYQMIDGEIVAKFVSEKPEIFTAPGPAILFGLYADGTAIPISNNNSRVRVYSCKIYGDNGQIVRDFIPVVDPTGIPCMYDRASQQFFYNQGTGEFIAGPALQ